MKEVATAHLGTIMEEWHSADLGTFTDEETIFDFGAIVVNVDKGFATVIDERRGAGNLLPRPSGLP